MQLIDQWSIWTISEAVWALLGIVLSLMTYCFFLRFKNNRRKEKQNELYSKWEEMVFGYLDGERTAEEVMRGVNGPDYDHFLHFLKRYLLALKGSDFERLSRLVTGTGLLPLLTHQLFNGDEQTRSEAAFFMGIVKAHDTRECLLRGLRDADDGVYYNCMLSLAKIGATDALDSILDQYRSRKRPSRDLLVSILFEFGIDSCQPLLKRLKGGVDDFTAPIVLDMLGHYRHYPSGEDILMTLDSSNNPEVLLSCIMALGNFEYLDAMPSLRGCLADEDWRIRSSAIWALGRIGDDSIANELTALLDDRSWWVRYRAAEALYNTSERGKERLVAIASKCGSGQASSIARVFLTDLEVGG